MSTDFESKLRNAAEKAKPLLETLVADLEREATSIRERDLDPRKLADEPKVQEARSAATDALEHLAAFAKSLDTLVKERASDLDQKIDVDSLKEHITAAPETMRSRIEDSQHHGIGERLKVVSSEAVERLETSAQEGRERVDEATQRGKQQVSSATQKSKNTTSEMLAALGWATAAGVVIYAVFMDEKRRKQAKSVAKATCDGMLVVVNSVRGKSKTA